MPHREKITKVCASSEKLLFLRECVYRTKLKRKILLLNECLKFEMYPQTLKSIPHSHHHHINQRGLRMLRGWVLELSQVPLQTNGSLFTTSWIFPSGDLSFLPLSITLKPDLGHLWVLYLSWECRSQTKGAISRNAAKIQVRSWPNNIMFQCFQHIN